MSDSTSFDNNNKEDKTNKEFVEVLEKEEGNEGGSERQPESKESLKALDKEEENEAEEEENMSSAPKLGPSTPRVKSKLSSKQLNYLHGDIGVFHLCSSCRAKKV